jgi:aminoglycoside phosphotransferase (APT) family kinase protein
VLRRPPFGTKARGAYAMKREYAILKALKPVYPYCPEPLVFCDDKAVITQQICDRYRHGQTTDRRFQMLFFGVHILEKAARRMMREGFS